MTKIATSFVNHYKLIPQTSLLQLSSYVEELASKLSNSKTKKQAQKARDQAKRCFQELGLNKYDLASSAPTTIAENSQLNLLRKEHKIGYALLVEYYGVMNDKPNTLAPKQENGILGSGANCNIIAEETVNELDLKIDDISDVEIYTPIGKLDIVE
ncbi:30044_t:CDS:2, partial [Gigaspora margarita]